MRVLRGDCATDFALSFICVSKKRLHEMRLLPVECAESAGRAGSGRQVNGVARIHR